MGFRKRRRYGKRRFARGKRKYRSYKKGAKRFSKGMPQVLCQVHRYSDTYDYSHATGVATNRYYIGNGMFDVDETGVGHQPLLFDQMCTVYRNYLVKACSMRVELVNTGTTTIQVVLTATTDHTTTTSVNGTIEQPGSVTRMIAPAEHCYLKMYRKTRSFYSALSTKDPDFMGTESANPANIWYFGVNISSQSAAQSSAALRVTTKQYVQWLCPIKQTTS